MKNYAKLLEDYENLHPLKRLIVLEDAITIMASRDKSSRSVDGCIVLAMGGTEKDLKEMDEE